MITDILEGKWKHAVSTAQSEWSDLTEEDLKKAEAGQDHLASVVQKRYGSTIDEAHQQVENFWNKHNPDHRI
jgi:uncharacterized protein YjbJ (UPF0337 family)